MMATQVNATWTKTLSLDRSEFTASYHHHHQPNQPATLIQHNIKTTLEQLRNAFLNLPPSDEETANNNKETESDSKPEVMKKTPRKISFKCKKTGSAHRRTPPSSVAQLASKYNQMVTAETTKSVLDEAKIQRILLRRVNSQKRDEPTACARKCSRRSSIKVLPAKKPMRPTTLAFDSPKNAVDLMSAGSVRAVIEIFERHSTVESPGSEKGEKPKVPERNPNLRTKTIVIRDGVRKLKVDNKEVTSISASAIRPESTNSSETANNNEEARQAPVEPSPQTANSNTVEPPQEPVESPEPPEVPVEPTEPSPESGVLQEPEPDLPEESKTEEEPVEIINIPLVITRRCDSMYETLQVKKTDLKAAKSEEAITQVVWPNTSFLWRQKSQQEPRAVYYNALASGKTPQVPPRPSKLAKKYGKVHVANENKHYEEVTTPKTRGDIYEELSQHYEYCQSNKYEEVSSTTDDGYEYFENVQTTERIYETLPNFPKRKEEPLPPRPSSRNSLSTLTESNCYETVSNNYESIYGAARSAEEGCWDGGSNRFSVVSSDQQSNSIYGHSLPDWVNQEGRVYSGKATSDLSTSDRSDEWVDISDSEENGKGSSGFVIVVERGQKNKKTPAWSRKIRDRWNKSHSTGDSGDLEHHYESLYNRTQPEYNENDDYDSFSSDTESECSFSKANPNDSGVDMGNSQLPDPPPNQVYGFTKLKASAGKHMRRLRRNWSLTKNDITKSISRMTKRKSRTDLDLLNDATFKVNLPPPAAAASSLDPAQQRLAIPPYQNVEFNGRDTTTTTTTPDASAGEEKTKIISRKKFLNKFRRSISMTAETASELTSSLHHGKPTSTFYLTESVDVDVKANEEEREKEVVQIRNKSTAVVRPQSPPPPIPVDANQNIDATIKQGKRSTSWYAECGLFKNADLSPKHPQRPSTTSWYAEIGLYQSSNGTATPSTTSSAENSAGSTTDKDDYDHVNNEKNEESGYYNQSIGSFNSEHADNVCNASPLNLEDEPLYQFYDAAVLESVCQDAISDVDYEDVGEKKYARARPTAMQLVAGKRNGIATCRTLWCEVPEVLQSAVLSSLSAHQKKLQEAKFEMITSEASYLNSLNVLTNHFMLNLHHSDLLSFDEKQILFGRIPAVKKCSERLLYDLEQCWQDNILLHGICEVVQKHAEENFHVYVSYCENQIALGGTLRKVKERANCGELVQQLEASSACQSLSLYSFLMLPMQRITRWPLLVDAVLKRLSHEDDEHLLCQYALATMNKIVSQCNESARKKEQEAEMRTIATQIEFSKGVPPLSIITRHRFLVRSGPLTQMQARGDDVKLTFGKRFTKIPLFLFLFNDLLLVTKPKDGTYAVINYCYRSYVELNVNDVIGGLPTKDTQGRNLLFLTLLENQDAKTVEMLLSCNSESDRERWIEALSPPKSEDPNETVYECWDCPQVTAVHGYGASQPDELALARGDIVNVTRKMADGWYHGERIRDGQTGWFPANYTVEVANPHVRARNLKQRYRLLAFSENYIKSK